MNTFPKELITKEDTVLDLFCAGFLGENTLQNFYPEFKSYLGIDNDKGKIRQMQLLFPAASFIWEDYFTSLKWIDFFDYKYDILISDPWSGEMEDGFKKIIIPFSEHIDKYMILGGLLPYPDEIGKFQFKEKMLRNANTNCYWYIYELKA